MTTATATMQSPRRLRTFVHAASIAPRIGSFLVLLVLPGALTIYLGFKGGGRDPEASATVLALLALLLAGRIVFAKKPFAGTSTPLLIAGGALVLFACWTWLSSAWSDAPARAFLEFQRTAVYVVIFLFFGSFVRRPGGVALVLKGVVIGIGALCIAGLASRLYPDAYSVAPALSPTRLSHPVGYWNSFGLLAAVGLVLMLHLACHEREPWLVRGLAAAAVPVAALTIYFTFSRGAAAAAAIGVALYLIVGRPRGAVGGLVSVVPTTLVAMQAAYGADLLATEENSTAAAVAQGHEVAAVLIACCVAAAVCRIALAPIDTRIVKLKLRTKGRASVAVAAAIVALLGIGVALAVDGPNRLERAWASFTKPEQGDDARTRFQDIRVGGRKEHWDVALGYYRQDRIRGVGAGTFETQWLRSRPSDGAVQNAHSLYFENLSELGLVGLGLLVAFMAAILVGVATGARGVRRPLHAAVLAVLVMWIAHAGVDWDWQLPAVSLWLFATTGAVLASGTARKAIFPFSVTLVGRALGVVVCLLLVALGTRTVVSEAALDDSVEYFNAGNCRAATARAATSLNALDIRPEPVAIRAYCDAERGRYRAAILGMATAASLDPTHWRYSYGLAVVRGWAGRDPRPQLRLARKLDPRAEILKSGVAAELARATDERSWRNLASIADQPID